MSAGQHEEDPKIRRMQDHTGYGASGSDSSARWETSMPRASSKPIRGLGRPCCMPLLDFQEGAAGSTPQQLPLFLGSRSIHWRSTEIKVRDDRGLFVPSDYASYYQVMLPFASAEEPFTKTGTLRVLFMAWYDIRYFIGKQIDSNENEDSMYVTDNDV